MRITHPDFKPRNRSFSAFLRGADSWWYSSGALAVFALMAACQKIWDTDIFWHLTEGEWALKHHTFLRIDHWSVSSSGRAFVTDYSLYHLVITILHSIAGFAGLSILNMLLFAAIALILAGAVPGRARGPIAAVCLAAALFVIQGRMRMRPETFTFLYLAITITLLERARRGELGIRRLWWLAVVMVLWVNMHSLFAVGLATIWTAVIGRWWDTRRAPWDWIRVAGGATVACLINPTPLQLIQQPIRFLGQANSRVATYAYGFAEFLPSWREPGAPEVIVVILLLALAVVGMGIGWRKRGARRNPATPPAGTEDPATRFPGPNVPAAHLLWLVAFGYLGAIAFRNLALAALVGGYLAASHAGAAIPQRQRWVARCVAGAIVLFGLLYVTGYEEAALRRTGRPGIGLLDDFFPFRIAAKIASVDRPGDVLPLDFGDGGPLIYSVNRDRTDPKSIIHRVYIDGRSDVFPQERYDEVFRIESEIASGPDGADRVVLPPTVRFLVVNFNDLQALRSLGASTRFRLYCLDRNHACFVQSGDADLSPFKIDWSEYDIPLSVNPPCALLGPTGPYRRTWLRGYPLDSHWRLGTVFAFLGRDDLAARYLECAEMLDSGPRAEREGTLAMVLARLEESDAAKGDLRAFHPPSVADPLLVRALYLLGRPGVCDPRTEEGPTHAIQKVLLLNRAGARDLAAEEIDRLVKARGASDPDLISLRTEIHAGLDESEERAESFLASHPAFTPPMQAFTLISAGLSQRALGLLAHEASPNALLTRGDILLRIGDVAAARGLYARAGNGSDVKERLAICDWGEGNLKGAFELLGPPDPLIVIIERGRSLRSMLDAYLGIDDSAGASGPGTSSPHP